MDLDYQKYIVANMPMNSRVWIYPAARLLGWNEALQTEEKIEKFITQWQSHGEKVIGDAKLFYGRFLVFFADENSVTVSGCSIDKIVHFVEQLSKELNIDFFNRQTLQFIVKDKIQDVPMAQINYAIENKFISGDTLFFDHSISSVYDFKHNWLIPIGTSWLGKKVKVNTSTSS